MGCEEVRARIYSANLSLKTLAGERSREMKNAILSTVLTVFVLALVSGCATMPQTWPDYERSAENKMVVIQEQIGDGLKTGALTPDQVTKFLTTLKGIRTDYSSLETKRSTGTNGISLI